MPSRRLVKDPERYKTVLCATWVQSGECPYGRKCQFAHGKEELRSRTAPPLCQAVPRQQQPPPHMAMGPGVRPQLPHAPMPLWPSASHPQQQPMGSLPLPPMPPLPTGPLPGSMHLERGLLLNPTMGATPPLPPGPPPSTLPPEYTAALAQIAAGAAALNAATRQQAAVAQQLQQHQHHQQQQLVGASLGGALECSPAMLPSSAAPSALPPLPLPGALLPGSLPASSLPSAAAPASAPPLPGALLPGSLQAAAAPTPTPPLPAALLPGASPAASMHAFPAALAPSMAPAMAPSMAPPMAAPAAMAPSAEPPLASAPDAAPLPVAGGREGAVSAAAAPAASTPAKLAALDVTDVSDELATFAMKCAVAEQELSNPSKLFDPSELWSPLRFNDRTGKLEAKHAMWRTDGSLTPLSQSGLISDSDGKLDSPLEPGITRRDVSFPTQMVRRAVSFIFNDQIDDPESPLREARAHVQSPHTAIAA